MTGRKTERTFYDRKYYYTHKKAVGKRNKDWRKKNHATVKRTRSKWRQVNRRQRIWYYRWCLYKLRRADYKQLLVNQNGQCAICRRFPPQGKELVVDHDHETGTVRGLLCTACNFAIGTYERLRKRYGDETLKGYLGGKRWTR